MRSYKKLLMWQKANLLTRSIYQVTSVFPKEELYGITSQIRRASLSVVLNIIEGYARQSKGDFRRFLDISLKSLAEIEYLLEISFHLGYIEKTTYNKLEDIRNECGKLIWSYRNKINSK